MSKRMMKEVRERRSEEVELSRIKEKRVKWNMIERNSGE